jgi:putative Holliday junction resolvase
MMRILAVDPGEKRLGIALSDPSGIIANPLMVIRHITRAMDAATIAQLADEHQAGLILVGQALDEENQPSVQGRRAAKLAEAIHQQTNLPVKLWDESGSTQAARQARQALGVRRARRQGHLDEIAAAYILQTYLDAQNAV